jgi:DnaK suppressor protein
MRSGKMRPEKKNGDAAAVPTQTDNNYRPSEKEPFMGERQREYFRTRLLNWRDEILKEAKETLAHLQAEKENHPDLADRASSETDRAPSCALATASASLLAR